MEFRLLGPLEVGQDGEALALGGAKQRALLACLLLHANEAVSRDRLIDDLWGDRAPETAENTLQVYVANLRKVLQPGRPKGARSDVLLTRPSGYMLKVADDEFDVFRFERLVEEGRRCLPSDPETASARFRDGLNLWRGPALADFPSEPFAAAAITRLEELRLTVIEDGIDAALAGARHAEVVPELESLVALHPLRERLRGQLMLALYRSGRQADACRLYDATRAVLLEELGLEPSPPLQTLFTAILRQAPFLAAPSEEAARHRAPPPSEPKADGARNNLPVELTSFVGREREVDDVTTLLGGARLVTLTGAGGSGKTRLALRVASRLADGYADGAWLVELAPVADPGLVPQTVGAAFGIREPPGQTMTEVLLERLRDRRFLLVLDNCEHLVQASAELAHALLAAGADLQILATSREALNIPGEAVWRVPALSLPDPDAPAAPAALAGYAAIRLFVERAAAAGPGFVLDHDNAAAVAAVCRRLDGIPLALELAAARIATMSPAEILQRLDRGFDLLTGGTRTVRPRQQTLRATIDWSHELLSPPEQVLFRRLAVFAGGWGLADAELVCAEGELVEWAVLDLLAHLVEKSLVLAEPGATGATRYRMLETLREYAWERLRAAGEETAVRNRHLAHFLELVEAARREKMESGSDAALPVVTLNQDNLRGALAWGRQADVLAALRLATGLLDFWLANNMEEGRRWLEGALTHVPEATPDRARGLLAAGSLVSLQQRYDDARRLLGESLAISIECGDRRTEAWARTGLGWVSWAMEDLSGAQVELERSRAMHEELGDRLGLARSLVHLGVAMDVPGHEAEARDHLEQAVVMAEQCGDRWGQVYGLFMLGYAEIDAGERAKAARHFRQALELRTGAFMAAPIEGFAALVAEDDPLRAMRLLGAAAAIRDRFAGRPPKVIVRRTERVKARAESHLEPTAARRAWEEGHRLSTEEALVDALEGPSVPRRDQRTFMFTGIVRSTNLVEAIGDGAWAHLLRWHDQTLRSLFARHGGEEVKSIGDGIFVAFPDPATAAECAVAIQRSLADHRARHGFAPDVRVGLHEAEATGVDDDDHGEGIHVAGRIAALAGAGEILASRPVIASRLNRCQPCELRSVQLRGLPNPIEIGSINWQN